MTLKPTIFTHSAVVPSRASVWTRPRLLVTCLVILAVATFLDTIDAIRTRLAI